MATINGFTNRAAELDFILTKMDGRSRCDMLEIRRIHYVNKTYATEWYETIMKEATDCSEEAKARLKKLYENMIMY